MSKDVVKEYKEHFYYKDIPNKDLITVVLDSKEYINNFKKSLTKEEIVLLDKLIPLFEEFLSFLEENGVYKMSFSLNLQSPMQDKNGSIKKIATNVSTFLPKLNNLIT